MPAGPPPPVETLHRAARRILGPRHEIVRHLAWATRRPPAEGTEIAGRALDWMHPVVCLEVLALAFAIQAGEVSVRRPPRMGRKMSAREARAAALALPGHWSG